MTSFICPNDTKNDSCDSDIAVTLLKRVFGDDFITAFIKSGEHPALVKTADTVIGSALQVLGGTAITVALLIVIIAVYRGIAHSANDGEAVGLSDRGGMMGLLGRPLFSLAMLAPTASGLPIINLIVITVTLWSNGVANKMYNIFAEKYTTVPGANADFYKNDSFKSANDLTKPAVYGAMMGYCVKAAREIASVSAAMKRSSPDTSNKDAPKTTYYFADTTGDVLGLSRKICGSYTDINYTQNYFDSKTTTHFLGLGSDVNTNDDRIQGITQVLHEISNVNKDINFNIMKLRSQYEKQAFYQGFMTAYGSQGTQAFTYSADFNTINSSSNYGNGWSVDVANIANVNQAPNVSLLLQSINSKGGLAEQLDTKVRSYIESHIAAGDIKNKSKTVQDQLTASGWIGAGTTQVILRKYSTEGLSAVFKKPYSVSMNIGYNADEIKEDPVLQKFSNSVTTVNEAVFSGLSSADPSVDNSQMKFEQQFEKAKTDPQAIKGLIDSSDFLAAPLMTLNEQAINTLIGTGDGEVDALYRIQSTGEYMILASTLGEVGITEVKILLTGFELAAEAGSGLTGNIITQGIGAKAGFDALVSIVKTITAVVTDLVLDPLSYLFSQFETIGRVLAVIIPSMPYLFILLAAVGWAVQIIQTSFGMPLWLIMHAVPDRSFIGSQQQGYVTLVALLFRPPLILSGFYVSFVLYDPVLTFFTQGFWQMQSTLSAGTATNSLSETIIYLSTLKFYWYMYATSLMVITYLIFGLVQELSDAVLAWLGTNLLHNFGNMNPVGVMQGIEGGMKQISSTAASLRNRKLSNMQGQLANLKEENRKKRESEGKENPTLDTVRDDPNGSAIDTGNSNPSAGVGALAGAGAGAGATTGTGSATTGDAATTSATTPLSSATTTTPLGGLGSGSTYGGVSGLTGGAGDDPDADDTKTSKLSSMDDLDDGVDLDKAGTWHDHDISGVASATGTALDGDPDSTHQTMLDENTSQTATYDKDGKLSSITQTRNKDGVTTSRTKNADGSSSISREDASSRSSIVTAPDGTSLTKDVNKTNGTARVTKTDASGKVLDSYNASVQSPSEDLAKLNKEGVSADKAKALHNVGLSGMASDTGTSLTSAPNSAEQKMLDNDIQQVATYDHNGNLSSITQTQIKDGVTSRQTVAADGSSSIDREDKNTRSAIVTNSDASTIASDLNKQTGIGKVTNTSSDGRSWDTAITSGGVELSKITATPNAKGGTDLVDESAISRTQRTVPASGVGFTESTFSKDASGNISSTPTSTTTQSVDSATGNITTQTENFATGESSVTTNFANGDMKQLRYADGKLNGMTVGTTDSKGVYTERESTVGADNVATVSSVTTTTPTGAVQVTNGAGQVIATGNVSKDTTGATVTTLTDANTQMSSIKTAFADNTTQEQTRNASGELLSTTIGTSTLSGNSMTTTTAAAGVTLALHKADGYFEGQHTAQAPITTSTPFASQAMNGTNGAEVVRQATAFSTLHNPVASPAEKATALTMLSLGSVPASDQRGAVTFITGNSKTDTGMAVTSGKYFANSADNKVTIGQGSATGISINPTAVTTQATFTPNTSGGFTYTGTHAGNPVTGSIGGGGAIVHNVNTPAGVVTTHANVGSGGYSQTLTNSSNQVVSTVNQQATPLGRRTVTTTSTAGGTPRVTTELATSDNRVITHTNASGGSSESVSVAFGNGVKVSNAGGKNKVDLRNAKFQRAVNPNSVNKPTTSTLAWAGRILARALKAIIG